MAVLNNIRKRSGILIAIIGFALFAFLIPELFKSGFSINGDNNIGSVNGTDIVTQEFMQKVAQVEKQGQGVSNTQAINSVWEQEIRSVLLNEEFEKLGLRIGPDQLINVIKSDPSISQNPQFLNEIGQFDENKFKEFVKSKRNDPNPASWTQWKNYENSLEKYAKELMYNNMIKGGVYVTKAEGKFKHEIETNKVDFDFVALPYSNINDDQVKVSDDEIMAYIKKFPKKYKSETTASFDYVLFEEKPSVEDEKAMETSINNILLGTLKYNEETNLTDTLPGFRNVKNVSEFVNANSDIKFDSTYLAKKDLPLDFQEQLYILEVGEVFGPYVFNGHQCVSKMVAKKASASVKASHILLAYQGAPQSSATRTKEEAKNLANDLLAQAKANPENFAVLASANTDDPGSKNTGGQYDNISKGQMVPTFDAYIFDNPIGSIGLVETDFGFHVIKVDDKYSGVLLGTVAQKIEPSETTIDNVYVKASKFEAETNEKDFEEVAKASALTVTPIVSIKASEENVQGLGAQREIVRWALSNDNSVGDVKRFDVPQGYVIAKLKSKNETGIMSIEASRDIITPILRNEKKAVLIRKKMSGSTLEEVAKASNSTVSNTVGVTLASPIVQNLGSEPKVVGTAFGLKSNTTSKLIDGANGVFMVRTKSIVSLPAVTNYNSYIIQEKAQQSSSAQSRAYLAIKEKATIKDNRARF